MRESDRPKRRRIPPMVGLIIVALAVIVAVVAYIIGNAYERRGMSTERGTVGDRFKEPTVEYDGQTYRYRKNEITTVLFMGIDRASDTEASGSQYRNGGQSDFLLLMLIDRERGQVIPLQIDRDTMAEITILGSFGNYAGTRRTQICLSHGFGDGGAQSCEFTEEAVSTLLFGVDIDFYVAMNLDGIAVLNDALGGITVTLEDDFSAYDPTMTPGVTLTLRGMQAEYYVRSRYYVGEGTNASRQLRQRNYMDLAADVIIAREHDNQNYVGELYDALEPYLITDMHRGRMINEAWKARDYERKSTISPEGTHGKDEYGFVTFEADMTALQELVLELFYEPM